MCTLVFSQLVSSILINLLVRNVWFCAISNNYNEVKTQTQHITVYNVIITIQSLSLDRWWSGEPKQATITLHK